MRAHSNSTRLMTGLGGYGGTMFSGIAVMPTALPIPARNSRPTPRTRPCRRGPAHDDPVTLRDDHVLVGVARTAVHNHPIHCRVIAPVPVAHADGIGHAAFKQLLDGLASDLRKREREDTHHRVPVGILRAGGHEAAPGLGTSHPTLQNALNRELTFQTYKNQERTAIDAPRRQPVSLDV